MLTRYMGYVTSRPEYMGCIFRMHSVHSFQLNYWWFMKSIKIVWLAAFSLSFVSGVYSGSVQAQSALVVYTTVHVSDTLFYPFI